ncbi:MAG: GyrI-like domain-containing protein [Bacteroidota bacterium]
MIPTKVEIVRLEPMRVASTYGFGVNPEEKAWQNLVEWATPKGLLEDLAAHPIFGFNNPYPVQGNPKYGYEFWIKVGPEIEPDDGVRIEEFLGGLYAVARCEVRGHPEENIPEGWRSLVDWCKNNHHALGHHHALEKFLSSPADVNRLILDLCCPIIS